MLPTSNTRLYLNANQNANINQIITREKALSMSKTMSKFYKKPKTNTEARQEYSEYITQPSPPKNEVDMKNEKYKKVINSKKDKNIINKKEKLSDSENTEEFNYIGDKDDLKNLDHIFRETTGYEIGEDDKNIDSNSDSDDWVDTYEHEKREKRENQNKYEKHPKVLYPFSHKNSSHFSQNYKDDDGSDILVEFIIYRVNNYAYNPFLEFMLYKTNNTFYLPNLMCNPTSQSKNINSNSSDSGSGIGSGIDSDIDNDNENIYDKVVSTLDSIFPSRNYKIKGKLIPSKNMNIVDDTYLGERYILFIECYSFFNKTDNEEIDEETEDEETDNTTFTPYIPENTKLWWVTINEIFNHKKVLFFPVHDSVVSLFYSYPEIMNIFMKGRLLEIPIVVYNGNNDKYTKYNAIFSLKKSSQFSRYGPFYYFTDLHSSFKYACYDVENDMRKFEKGGLLRTILFPKKIKMFLERDKIDDSNMAHHLFEKYPEKINTGQFRDNDNKWVKNYNTAYNGEYMIDYDRYQLEDDNLNEDEKDEKVINTKNKSKKPFPVMFCISEYNQQQVLSYHYVNTKNIPDEYNYKFKDYKLL
jgi:hypothetical protein